MANLEVIALDTVTPQLKAPQAGDGYAMPRPVTVTEVVGSTALTLTGATQTTAVPVLNATQTWNNVATTFTGIKLNVTDTTSAAASLLMDLQVGAASKFNVDKTGKVTFGTAGNNSIFNIVGTTNLSISASSSVQFPRSSGANGFTLDHGANRFALYSGYIIGFATANNAPDVFIGRKAAANFALGGGDAASLIAQTLSVGNIVAGTSNTAGANFTIAGSQGTGTGAGGSILFQTAPAGSAGTAQNALVTQVTVAGSGGTTLTEVVGASALTLTGATQTTAVPVLNATQTWNNAAVVFTGIKLNITDTASNASSSLFDLQLAGTSKFKIEKSGTLYLRTFSTSGDISTDGTGRFLFNSGATAGARITGTLQLGSSDLILSRKGAANFQLGDPVAQTAGVQSVVAGTSNTVGQNFTVRGSQGTGTGVGGDIIFQVAPAGSAGTAQNALATAMRVYNDKTVTLGAAFTVATLPAAGTQGRKAWVTDATAPTFLGALTGGGAVVTPVFDNGTIWIAG